MEELSHLFVRFELSVENKPRIANNVEDADRIVLQAQVTFDRTFLDKHHVSALVAYEQKKYEKKHSYLKREYDFTRQM